MKYFVVVVLVIVSYSLCAGKNLPCQLFDENLKMLEKYCENYHGFVPENCSSAFDFIESSHVTQLKMQGCDAETIRDTVINFRNVHIFDISSSHSSPIVNATDVVQFLGYSIWDINLSGNFVGKLDAKAFEILFDNLGRLSLSNTMLASFDFGIIKNPQNLWTLDISHNNLKHISNISLLVCFTNLRELNVAENQLPNAKQIIQHLSSPIETLDLSGNTVGTLNIFTFQRLNTLKKLCLASTNLMISSRNPFASLHSLNFLDISHNNLMNVDFTGLSMTLNKLEHFNAANCQIRNASQVIQHLGRSIQMLNLSGNFVGTLNDRSFEECPNLKYVILKNAQISQIDSATLQYQTNLRVLDVSHNKLDKLDFKFVSRNLEQINLNGNDLTTLDNFDRAHFKWLTSLKVEWNRFPCPYLHQLFKNNKDLLFGEHWHQKPDRDCRKTTERIGGFLNGVYDKLKFW